MKYSIKTQPRMGRNILTMGVAHRREPCNLNKPCKGAIDFALTGLNKISPTKRTGLHPVLIDSALSGLTLI